MEFRFKPIGLVHSPFKETAEIEVRRLAEPDGFSDVEGRIEIFQEFEAGLDDLDGFSHLIAVCVFHKAEGYRLRTKPFLDDQLRGVFATRSPHRPNPIALTVLKILERDGRNLKVSGLDLIDGTPVLDLKPYTPRDRRAPARFGWLGKKMKGVK